MSEDRREYYRRRYRSDPERFKNRVSEYAKRNPELVKSWKRVSAWRSRGVEFSFRDFKALLEKQGGVCAICRSDEDGELGKFQLDHDHETGMVRGVLCQRCNGTILPALESPIRAMAEVYLARGGFL